MNIDQAIEILDRQTGVAEEFEKWDCMDAFKLGIEALKRLQEHSPYPHEYLGGPLPGETKD